MDNLLQMAWPFILMGVIFYVMIYRPQKRDQKKRTEMLDSLKVGTNIVTIGGILGTITKVREAKANVVKAQESYRQISDQVRLAVRTSYLSMREAEKRIKTTEVAVAQAEEDYRIAQLRYRAGVGTNTDVMDASVALTTAKNNYLQALYDYNTSTALLEQSMGVPVENE